MGAKAAVAVFITILVLFLLGSAYNYINLTGVMNFTDIFNGTAETLLFTQLSLDVASALPVAYQYDAQQAFYYLFFIGFLAAFVYAVIAAFRSN